MGLIDGQRLKSSSTETQAAYLTPAEEAAFFDSRLDNVSFVFGVTKRGARDDSRLFVVNLEKEEPVLAIRSLMEPIQGSLAEIPLTKLTSTGLSKQLTTFVSSVTRIQSCCWSWRGVYRLVLIANRRVATGYAATSCGPLPEMAWTRSLFENSFGEI